jgi:hypothetical protein
MNTHKSDRLAFARRIERVRDIVQGEVTRRAAAPANGVSDRLRASRSVR